MTTDLDPGRAIDRDALAERLCETVRWLGGRGWSPATSGNFSARLDSDPVRALITSSGVDKQALRPEQLMVVDADGGPAPGETLKPSAETLLHTRLYRRDPRIGCVLHTHSVWNTLVGQHYLLHEPLDLRGFELQKGVRGISTHESTIRVPIVPNSQDMSELADRMEELRAREAGLDGAAAPCAAFLIAGHGLYTWGFGSGPAAIAEARRHIETFEFLFECVGRRTPFRPY
jgi:methylthioribulose-1-phosphate dehydratase